MAEWLLPASRVQQLVPDGPLTERRDRSALALAGGRGLPGDLAEERPDRPRGQLPDLAVVVGALVRTVRPGAKFVIM